MARKHILKVKKYKVKTGDTLQSIADSAGIPLANIIKFNWNAESIEEVNKYLRGTVGCSRKDEVSGNYIFSDDDDPGIIYIPEKHDKKFESSTTNVIKIQAPELKVFNPVECCVDFRPNSKWTGEYGFDWMRLADFPVIVEGNSIFGSEKFEAIVGYHKIDKVEKGVTKSIIDPDGNSFSGKFEVNKNKYDDLKKEYDQRIIDFSDYFDVLRVVENFSSYASIFVNSSRFTVPQTIQIQAFITANKPPENIYLKYDKDIFSVDPNVLPVSTQHKDIKITCNKEITSDTFIEARAQFFDKNGAEQDVLIGKLIVVPNDKPNRRLLKTLLVNVKTPAITAIGSRTGNSKSNLPFVEKILHQSLIDPETAEESLDFTIDKDTEKNFNDNYVVGSKINSEGAKNKKSIHQYFLDALGDKLKKAGDNLNKYDDYLKAFYLGENSSEGLYGYSSGKSVVCFLNAVESTAVHEWLHSLGLPHTFSGYDLAGKIAPYTYQYKQTENIMDYTHHLATNATNAFYKKARISLYHWQWNIAKNSSLVKKEI